MNKENTFKMVGELTIEKFTSGKLVEKIHVPNLVVTTGKNYVASRMVGTTSNVMTHMEIGSGVTAAAAGDTALQTTFGAWGRQAFNIAASAINNQVTYSAIFPAGAGNSGAITEAGIFNASSGGTMLCRTVFPVVNKAEGDSINITWVVSAS